MNIKICNFDGEFVEIDSTKYDKVNFSYKNTNDLKTCLIEIYGDFQKVDDIYTKSNELFEKVKSVFMSGVNVIENPSIDNYVTTICEITNMSMFNKTKEAEDGKCFLNINISIVRRIN